MSATRSSVAIIVHSSKPTHSEEASFVQCLRILGRHRITLVCPNSLDLERYVGLSAQHAMTLGIQRFEDRWFRSVGTYNKFMLHPGFYHCFEKWDYILVYQLDAWVFRDELEKWCEKEYAYIGAPFFTDRGELMPFAGNGGLSLRHVQSFIMVLEGTYRPKRWNSAFMFTRIPARNALRMAVKHTIHLLEMAFCRLSTKWYCSLLHEHEDFIFSKVFSLLGDKNVPLPHEAALFAFERFPRKLFAMTNGVLPFGCHAFEKYDPEFWQTWGHSAK